MVVGRVTIDLVVAMIKDLTQAFGWAEVPLIAGDVDVVHDGGDWSKSGIERTMELYI